MRGPSLRVDGRIWQVQFVSCRDSQKVKKNSRFDPKRTVKQRIAGDALQQIASPSGHSMDRSHSGADFRGTQARGRSGLPCGAMFDGRDIIASAKCESISTPAQSSSTSRSKARSVRKTLRAAPAAHSPSFERFHPMLPREDRRTAGAPHTRARAPARSHCPADGEACSCDHHQRQ